VSIFINIIGLTAAFLAIITFAPQAWKTYKTKNTKQISLLTYIIYDLANAFFLLFGILSIALPVMWPDGADSTEIIVWGLTLILPYTATIIASTIIIYYKVQNIKKYGETTKRMES